MDGIVDNVRFLDLAEKVIPTLVGIKHSSPNLNSLMRCHRYGGGKYQILRGSDDVSRQQYGKVSAADRI